MLFTLRCVEYMASSVLQDRQCVWCKNFARGVENVVDESKPGQFVVLMTDATIATVESLVQSDRLVSISV